MKKGLLIFAVLLAWQSAGGTVLTSAMLPYTTVANNETITLAADSIGSATNGITVAHTGVTIDGTRAGGRGKLQFGITTGTGYFGIHCNNTVQNWNLTIKNLVIAQNNSMDTSATAIELTQGDFFTVQDCDIYIHGHDAQAINWSTGTSFSMLLSQRVQVWDSSVSMTARDVFTGAVFHSIQTPSAARLGIGGRIYHARFEQTNIWLLPQQGWAIRGAWYLYACTTRMATQNTTATQRGNGYSLLARNAVLSSDPANYPTGAEYCDFAVDSTINYRLNLGGRGIHIHGDQIGSPSYPILYRYNRIFASLGVLGGENFNNAHCIRGEAEGANNIGHDIEIAYNTLISGSDDNPATSWRAQSAMPIFINFGAPDYNINIHDNNITAYSFGIAAPGIDDEAFAVRLDFLSGRGATQPGDGYDSSVVFTNNTINVGVPFSSSYCALFENNTIAKLPIDSCATNTSTDGPCLAILGLRSSDGSRADSGTHYISNTYSGISATSIIEENASYATECNAYVGLRHHTIVRDASSNPVSGANVYYIKSPYTNASDTVYRGVTNPSGEAIGIVDFYRERQVGASITETDFNPFKIIAIKGADKDSLSGTTLVATTTTTNLTFGAGAGLPPVSLDVRGGVTVRGGVDVRKR